MVLRAALCLCLRLLTCAPGSLHQDGVVRLLWHPSKPVVITGCLGGCVSFWDARTGETLKTLFGHRQYLLDLATNDGVTLVSSSDDKRALVYQVEE